MVFVCEVVVFKTRFPGCHLILCMQPHLSRCSTASHRGSYICSEVFTDVCVTCSMAGYGPCSLVSDGHNKDRLISYSKSVLLDTEDVLTSHRFLIVNPNIKVFPLNNPKVCWL